MYSQELNRDQVTLSYPKKLKMVRQHIDQTMRTRNFKTRNQRIERQYWSKVIKREMSAQKEKGLLSEEGNWTVFGTRFL